MFSVKRIILPLMLLASLSLPAQAQIISEDKPFYFGKWMVRDNTAPRHVTVNVDGSYTNSPELIMLSPPQPGVYDVTGLPSFAIISSVVVTRTQEMRAGSPKRFDIDNFTTQMLNADINGTSQLTIGGRATTIGGGGVYPDANYVGEIRIDINY